MKAKTEELLYVILWASEMLCRPTYRNLSESFEGWAYRTGLLRQLQRLERKQWLEVETNPSGHRLHRLTEQGRVQSLGGRDPEVWWARPWDGCWRLALFDVPEVSKITRHRLRRYLRGRCFGCLQNSVWITPHPMDEQRDQLAGANGREFADSHGRAAVLGGKGL